jgi:hypothetical protein
LTDGAGIPLGLAIGGANKNDHKLMEQTLTCLPVVRPEPTEDTPQGLCLDKGYDYDSVRELAAEFGRGSAGDQAGSGLQSPSLGSGADAFVDEPVSSPSNALGKESGQLLGTAASGLCLHHLQTSGPIRIGS